ncbi:hypothetical protein B0H13DRAFT_2314449 [Mycena leptocephala]|nr:hypothetical protein B0H13DRAFT_2314449 [Mycena leptocephala]
MAFSVCWTLPYSVGPTKTHSLISIIQRTYPHIERAWPALDVSNILRPMRNQASTTVAAAGGGGTFRHRIMIHLGPRAKRGPALTTEQLYLTAEHTPEVPAEIVLKPYHHCNICWSIKSHPVAYKCGHSHCYVCIRVWLQKNLSCPHCKATVHETPYIHMGERQAIEADYPQWVDKSKVDLRWSGLQFPAPR